jgi:Carboxypeptidase regulatory-like domain
MALRFKSGLMAFAFVGLGWASSCLAQSSQQTLSPDRDHQPASGSISGTIVDQSGALVAQARVKLTRGDQSPKQETPSSQQEQSTEVPSNEALSNGDGQFSFANIPPGPFQITITSTGFAAQTVSGVLHAGETYAVPPIALAVATAVTDVEVVLSPAEVAEEQVKAQEKQRVLGIVPNFFVTYVPNPVPLTSKQKFQLAWKTVIDPFTLIVNGAFAGVEQAQNHFSGYGQGFEGYAKRYGAGYADTLTGTFIGGAILPSLLKQDPRYFYKGIGSTRSRILYAIAFSVICKGDNRRWQPNYSGVLGSLAAGGISNLYYPANDRNGPGLTFENAAIGIGSTAVGNLFQEFLVRKLTPKLPHNNPPKP